MVEAKTEGRVTADQLNKVHQDISVSGLEDQPAQGQEERLRQHAAGSSGERKEEQPVMAVDP